MTSVDYFLVALTGLAIVLVVCALRLTGMF